MLASNLTRPAMDSYIEEHKPLYTIIGSQVKEVTPLFIRFSSDHVWHFEFAEDVEVNEDYLYTDYNEAFGVLTRW